MPEVSEKSLRHALQRQRGVPVARRQSYTASQAQPGHTGRPPVADHRIAANSVSASRADSRITVASDSVRAAEVSRKC